MYEFDIFSFHARWHYVSYVHDRCYCFLDLLQESKRVILLILEVSIAGLGK